MSPAVLVLENVLSWDQWRTKRQIAGLLGVSPREVEAMVEAARKLGAIPIMSSGEGYRLARDPNEYETNIASRRRRAIGQLVTVRGERGHLRRWRAKNIEQSTLWP